MDPSSELRNSESGNIIGVFTTISEALAVVRHVLDAHGESFAQDLALSHRYGEHPGGGEGHARSAVLEGSESHVNREPAARSRAGGVLVLLRA